MSGTSIKRGQLVFVSPGDSAAQILTIELGSVNIAGYNLDNGMKPLG